MRGNFKRSIPYLVVVFAFLLGLCLGLCLSKNTRIFRRILRCPQMIYMVGKNSRRPQTLKQEVKTSEFLLVGVLIKGQELDRRGGILYDDFSETNTKCIFFATKGHSSSHNREVVYLDGINDSSKIEVIYLRMFTYFSQHYQNDFNWFLLTESCFFINEKKMIFLQSLDHSKELLFIPEVARVSNVDENGYSGESQWSFGIKEILKRYNRSRSGSRASNRITMDNSTSHRETKGYQRSKLDLVRLFQPGIIMSKSLLHKLLTLTDHCFDKRNDIPTCFERRVEFSFKQEENTTISEVKMLNSITCQSEDFTTKSVTADLSQNLECMYKVRVQLLSNRVLALSKNSRVFQNKLSILEGFISSSVYDMLEQIRTIPYSRFQPVEESSMFTLNRKYPINSKISWSLRNHEFEGVRRIIRTTMDTIRDAHQEDIQFHALYYGYKLNHPIRRLQHVFSIFTNKERHITRSRQEFGAIQRRVLKASQKVSVNIVVPLAGRLRNFKQFMVNVENNILKREEQISILVVYFPETSPFLEHKKIFDKYNMTYPRSKFNWLNLSGVFARARALQAAVEFYKDNKLLFFADVDLSFNTDYLQRCRDNTAAKKQVYFPVMFKLYNPKIIGSALNSTDFFQSFDQRVGDWALYSFGPVCVYRDDVIAIGGFNVAIRDWGYEDVQFLESFISTRKYDIIRAADPGLVHIYHAHTNCDVIINKIQRLMCKGAMLNGLASKESIVDYLVEKMHLKI